MIDTTNRNENQNQNGAEEEGGPVKFLAAKDRDFIQTFCIDIIRLKKNERIPTKAVKG